MEHIADLKIVSATSKNGQEYKQLVIVFKNGYEFRTFLNNEQVFIISSILRG